MKWHMPVEERFWAYVDRRGPDECWKWLGNEDGKFRVSKNPPVAFRFRKMAWMIGNPERKPQSGDVFRATCNTESCCNPLHLSKETSEARRIRHAANLKKQERKRKEWYQELKRGYSCARCGFSNPAALTFHHRDPKTKKFAISRAFQNSKEAVLAEIEKCEPLCANCHLIHHWNERQESSLLST